MSALCSPTGMELGFSAGYKLYYLMNQFEKFRAGHYVRVNFVKAISYKFADITGMELGFSAGYIQIFAVLKAHKASHIKRHLQVFMNTTFKTTYICKLITYCLDKIHTNIVSCSELLKLIHKKENLRKYKNKSEQI
jgi:hypothetical protein